MAKWSIRNFFKRGRRWVYGAGGSLQMAFTSYNFADAIFLGIVKKVLEGLQNTEYFLIDDETASFQRKRLFVSFRILLENKIEQILISYIKEGVVHFIVNFETSEIELTDKERLATHSIYSTSMKALGTSDYEILKEDFEHIDNILNAVSTSVKRLGVLTILTPRAGEGVPVLMDEKDVKEFEEDISRDYGVLDHQSPIKIMRRSFDVSTISLAGANLRTNENLQTAVKIVCDVLEVPYELVASAIVGNPNQTGVYQEQGLIRLYKTVEKYISVFVKFAEKELGLKIDYDILTKPEEGLRTEWEAKEKVIDTLSKGMEKGLIDEDTAKEIIETIF